MDAVILASGLAATSSEKPCHRGQRAGFQWLAEHVVLTGFDGLGQCATRQGLAFDEPLRAVGRQGFAGPVRLGNDVQEVA